MRALRPSGTDPTSTGVQLARSDGIASATIRAAVTAAIRPGRAITRPAIRYQRSCAPPRSRAFSFTFQSANSAGAIVSDASAAMTATLAPPIPIDCRKLSGKTVREAIARATVAALKTTVRPAVAIVSRSAFAPGPLRSSSSR